MLNSYRISYSLKVEVTVPVLLYGSGLEVIQCIAQNQIIKNIRLKQKKSQIQGHNLHTGIYLNRRFTTLARIVAQYKQKNINIIIIT